MVKGGVLLFAMLAKGSYRVLFAIFLSFLHLSIAREAHKSQFGPSIRAKFLNFDTKTEVCPLKALSMVKGG